MNTTAKLLDYFRFTIGFVSFSLLIGGCGPSESEFKEYASYLSPDNTSIVAISIAPAKLAYGPTSVRIALIDGKSGNSNHIVSTKIANDGVPLSDKNVIASWIDADTLQLCLSGDEQQDEQIEIKLSQASYLSSNVECTK